MRRLLIALGLTVLAAGIAVPAYAHDAYDDSQAHPLRLAAYAVHPVGFALEWMIARPIHFVVSNPGLERIFGHVPHENPFGGYSTYDID